jgi:hypothetical protein
MKLGKKPARPEAVKFKLASFIDYSKLPKPPRSFGHEKTFDPMGWGMLGNANYGDCVWAGAAHETMLWNAECGINVPFNDYSVLQDYSAATGFNANDPNSDQGTDMKDAASYRRRTGIVDANGTRHKIAAYLSITPGDLREHYVALYLFGAVGLGIEFPASAMDQTNAGKIWRVVPRSPIEGGHYVSLVARRRSLACVTWGQIQPLTSGFLAKYNDESIVYLSESMLQARKSPEGFDYDTLLSYLNSLK